MKRLAILLPALITSFCALAQFNPGDIGYPLNAEKIMREAHVKTQTLTLVDQENYSTEMSTSYYDKDGFLLSTNYAVDTTIDPEYREPAMSDIYNYYPDGSIRTIVLQGYDMVDITYGFEYDRKGKLTASVIASAEAREYTYSYNDKGQIAHRYGKGARFVYENEEDTEGKLEMIDLEQTDYVWDDKGNLVEETFYYLKEWTQRTVYQYNDAGQLTRMEVYYENGPTATPAFNTVYQYNDKGLLTESVTTETDFTLRSVYTYTYY